MGGMGNFIVGDVTTVHVGVEVLYRQFPNSNDFDDGNWVRSGITVDTGTLRGSFECWLCTYDFDNFRRGLVPLYESLQGKAEFHTLEGQLSIELRGDGLGHIDGDVVVVDRDVATTPELKFTLSIDQTYLPKLIAELEEVQQLFPIVGSR